MPRVRQRRRGDRAADDCRRVEVPSAACLSREDDAHDPPAAAVQLELVADLETPVELDLVSTSVRVFEVNLRHLLRIGQTSESLSDSGYRAPMRKRPRRPISPTFFLWAVAVGMAIMFVAAYVSQRT
jgi:hypothetical protein